MMRAGEFEHAIGDWSAALPHPRLRVYRNNVSSALVNALRVRFPVTEQLTGAAFFAVMAAAFAGKNRPSSPVLIAYGAEFPEFIRQFPPAAGVSYLGDLAQLESLWWRAYHAADAPPLDPRTLSAVAPEQFGSLVFRPHPSFGLLRSLHPVGSIWSAHHGGAPMAVAVTRPGECVAVVRPAGEVALHILSPVSTAFLEAIARGECLANAVERVQEVHPGFDIGTELNLLLSAGFTAGFTQ